MITNCPICRYSLEGLPEKHRCPECAFEYDKTATAFSPPVRGRVWWVGFYAGLGGALLFFLLWWFFPGRINLFPAIYCGALLLGSFRRGKKRDVCAVVVYDDRIDEIVNHSIARSMGIPEIDRAYWSFIDGHIRLCQDGEVVESFKLSGSIYPNRVAKAVAREINNRALAKR